MLGSETHASAYATQHRDVDRGSFSALLLFQSNEERHFSVYFVQLSLRLRFEVVDLERSLFVLQASSLLSTLLSTISGVYPPIISVRSHSIRLIQLRSGPTVSLAGEHFKPASIDFGR